MTLVAPHPPVEKNEPGLILARASSSVQGMASSIIAEMDASSDHRVVVRAIGAGAVNQAIKGTIAARQRLLGRDNGEELIVVPSFVTVSGVDVAKPTVSAVVLTCRLL